MNIMLVLLIMSTNDRGNVWTPHIEHYATMDACEADAKLIQTSIRRQIDASVQRQANRFESRGEKKASEKIGVSHECIDTTSAAQKQSK